MTLPHDLALAIGRRALDLCSAGHAADPIGHVVEAVKNDRARPSRWVGDPPMVLDFPALYAAGLAHEATRHAHRHEAVADGVEIGRAPDAWLAIVDSDRFRDLARLELDRRVGLEADSAPGIAAAARAPLPGACGAPGDENAPHLFCGRGPRHLGRHGAEDEHGRRRDWGPSFTREMRDEERTTR